MLSRALRQQVVGFEVASPRLWENETDQDCYLKPGDTMVHYSPPVGGENIDENWAGALTLELPKHAQAPLLLHPASGRLGGNPCLSPSHALGPRALGALGFQSPL